LASLNCAFFPRACDISLNYVGCFDFEAALLHYIGCFFRENIFLYIGWSCDNSFDNKKDKTLVCKKRIAIMFSGELLEYFDF